MSKTGIVLIIIYIVIAFQPVWYAFIESGKSTYGLLGSRFGLFVVTLPGSMLVDWCKSFVDPANYSLKDKIENLVYIVSLLVNIVILYFIGSGISKLYAHFFK